MVEGPLDPGSDEEEPEVMLGLTTVRKPLKCDWAMLAPMFDYFWLEYFVHEILASEQYKKVTTSVDLPLKFDPNCNWTKNG